MPVKKAKEVALEAHAGQLDLARKPYAGHLGRVVKNIYPITSYFLLLRDPEVEQLMNDYDISEVVELAEAGAWLHDVLEDTATSLEQLSELGFPSEVLIAVNNMTKRKGEGRDDYLARAKSHPLSKIIKVSDLIDNMDMGRLATITNRDVQRQEKYHRNLAFLVGKGSGRKLYAEILDWCQG